MVRVPSPFQRMLRRLLLGLVALLGGWVGVRAAWARARLARLPVGHRHRAAVAREVARLERLRDWLADPDFFDDPRLIGTLAEVMRVRNDAGRRGWVRLRWIYGWATRFRRLPRAVLRLGADGFLAAERSRCALV